MVWWRQVGSIRVVLLPFSTVDFDLLAFGRNHVNLSQRNLLQWQREGGVGLRSVGIVFRSRERNFAPTHVGANLAFARVWFQNEWMSMRVA